MSICLFNQNQISWESTTLGFWYTELLERNAQFRTWFLTDRPKVMFVVGVKIMCRDDNLFSCFLWFCEHFMDDYKICF